MPTIREQAELLDIAHDAITVIDLQKHVLCWNHAAEKLYGWPVEEALGQDAGRLLFPESAGDFIPAIETVLQTGEWSGELRQVDRSHKPLLVHSRATLMRDSTGNAKSLLFVCTDITDKRVMERRCRRAERLETVGAMVGGIAHDLNNVLAPVALVVDLLRPSFQGKEEDVLFQTLSSSAERCAGMVRQLVSFSRKLEASQRVLHPANIIKEISRIIIDTFPKSLQLSFDASDAEWEFMADATQIQQALLNLCMNARDAMPHGGLLRLTVRNTWLDETAASSQPGMRAGPYIAFEVCDSGVGMSPEVLGKIFTPFFTTKPVGSGTGMGLVTVRDIAHQHEGFIQVWSEAGHGSRFTVCFPALEFRTAKQRPA